MRVMRRIELVFAFLLGACACPRPPAATADEATPAPAVAETPPPAVASADGEHAPTPFTVEQIRDATHVGRTYRFRMEENGAPAREHLIEFTAVDAEGCTIRVTDRDASGQATGAPEESRSTWVEIGRHALFPREATTITHETVEVPAGRFDAILYTVSASPAGRRMVQKYWFARELPGAPVRVVHEVDGAPVMSMTLLEHRNP